MKQITIVVPVYNVKKYLNRCMESILNQTYSELEIILVDDGATDGSGLVCDGYAKMDKRVKVIHKKNGGLSSARNAGIEAATGEYIGFVDSDDWIAVDMFENLSKLMKMYDCDISVCGIRRIQKYEKDEGNAFDFENVSIYNSKEYQKKILKVGTQDSNHYAVNKLYKTENMKKVRYPVGLIDEDVEGTFLAVLKAEKIVVSDSIGYYYWINPDSITMQQFSKQQLDFITICERVVDISRKYCDTEIQNDARLFRYRADFALLSKMAISEIADEYKFQWKEDAGILASGIKQHYSDLIKIQLPFSRKILMKLFCINYKVTFFLIRSMRQIINQKRKDMV